MPALVHTVKCWSSVSGMHLKARNPRVSINKFWKVTLSLHTFSTSRDVALPVPCDSTTRPLQIGPRTHEHDNRNAGGPFELLFRFPFFLPLGRFSVENQSIIWEQKWAHSSDSISRIVVSLLFSQPFRRGNHFNARKARANRKSKKKRKQLRQQLLRKEVDQQLNLI